MKKKEKGCAILFIPALLISVCLIAGIALLIFGIHQKSELDAKLDGYAETEGYFCGEELYNIDKKGNATYTLFYSYTVDGKEYMAHTDYGTEAIPDIGSAREIYYDPDDPDAAVVGDVRGPEIMIFMGGFFTLGAAVFILVGLSASGKLDKLRFNVMDIFIGLFLLVMGTGIIYMITEGFSFKVLWMMAGPFAFIPIMFLFVGAHLIIRGIMHK